MNKKISLIGFGNIGTQIAYSFIINKVNNVKLIIKDRSNIKGKILDLQNTISLLNLNLKIEEASTDEDISNSDVIIVTAGIKRNPEIHKTREDLIEANKEIIEDIAKNIKKFSPDSFIIIATNPVDFILEHFINISKVPKNMAVGLSGVLDSTRYKQLLSEKYKINLENINTSVIGFHNENMIPSRQFSSINSNSIESLIKEKELNENDIKNLEERTIQMGYEITKNGTSAYFAPALSLFKMANAFINNTKEVLICSILQTSKEFEFIKDTICFGMPVKIGNKGIEEIIKLNLNEKELKKLKESYIENSLKLKK